MTLAQDILAGNREITEEEALNILHSKEDWWSIFCSSCLPKESSDAKFSKIKCFVKRQTRYLQ